MMKRIVLLFALVISLQSVRAQDIPFIDLGVKGGVNLSWIRNLPEEFNFQQDPQIGFVAGVYSRIKIPILGFYVQPEAVVSQLRGQFTVDVPGINLIPEPVTGTIIYTNLDIPILIGKRIGIGPLGVRIHAGPVLSTILSAKTKVEAQGMEEELDITGDVDSFNFSIQAGAAVDISRFTFDARYQHGFTNFVEDIVLGDENQNFSAFQFTVGFKLL